MPGVKSFNLREGINPIWKDQTQLQYPRADPSSVSCHLGRAAIVACLRVLMAARISLRRTSFRRRK